MCKYQLHQRVEAIVESIQPYGVFVRLADGTRAYIRRRELDLDADVDPARVVRKGDTITAEVIALVKTGKHILNRARARMIGGTRPVRFRPSQIQPPSARGKRSSTRTVLVTDFLAIVVSPF